MCEYFNFNITLITTNYPKIYIWFDFSKIIKTLRARPSKKKEIEKFSSYPLNMTIWMQFVNLQILVLNATRV